MEYTITQYLEANPGFDRNSEIINLDNTGITSLEGIDLLPKVVKFYARDNNIRVIGYNTSKTITQFPNSLKDIYLDNNKINKIVGLPVGLETLVLSNNMLTSTPNSKLFTKNIIKIDLSFNKINRLNEFPIYVNMMYLNDNNISKLIKVNEHLLCLSLDNNNISNIDILSKSNIERLYLDNNVLTNLILPDKLKILSCNNNSIVNVVNKMNNIEFFSCLNNKISNFRFIGNKINTLIISNNPIKIFPDFIKFTNLYKLICSKCNLHKLGSLPDSLEYLDCSYNSIKEFKLCIKNLSTLIISNNPTTEIINPGNLHYLECYNTKIKDFSIMKKVRTIKFRYDKKLLPNRFTNWEVNHTTYNEATLEIFFEQNILKREDHGLLALDIDLYSKQNRINKYNAKLQKFVDKGRTRRERRVLVVKNSNSLENQLSNLAI